MNTDTHRATPPNASIETSLQSVVTAKAWVIAAKRTGSPQLVAHAEWELQAAVDAARDLGVEWGQIGSTLGIARGNAYQRYRKRLSLSDFPARRGVVGERCFVPPL